MITAIAGLEKGIITPEDTINCTGFYWRVEPKRCWNWDRGGHGRVNLKRAIAESCNIYFYDLGYRTGIQALTEYADLFGMGKPTGIDLHPGEKGGFLATPEWRNEQFGEPWQPGETLSAAIGQGFSTCTPLQMANYVAMIANGGIRYRPYLVDKVISPEGEVVKTLLRKYWTGLQWPRNPGLGAGRDGGCCRTPGTGYGTFANSPLAVAGKTGTAENPHGDSHGWFVGFALPGAGDRCCRPHRARGGGSSAAAR